MRSAERRKVNALEMKCLRSLVGVSRMDRVRYKEVRIGELEYKGVSEKSRSESIEMVWACERMDEYRRARRVLMAEVSGGRL